MGAWGPQPFECDEACDLAHDLLKQKDKEAFLIQSLAWPPEGNGSETLAAAEIVAALLGRPCPQVAAAGAYTQKLAAWLETPDMKVTPQLHAAAQAAARNLLGPESELASLWADSFGSDDNQWRRQTEDLLKRLSE
jgi:hypothetical protein